MLFRSSEVGIANANILQTEMELVEVVEAEALVAGDDAELMV